MYTIYETPVSLIWNYDNDESSSDLGTSRVLSSLAGDWGLPGTYPLSIIMDMTKHVIIITAKILA